MSVSSEQSATDKHRTIEQENAYKSAEVLERLYHDEGLSQAEIATELNVGNTTVHRWMEKLGIGRRDRIEASNETHRKRIASYDISPSGHERWRSGEFGENVDVYVHSLLAVAEGADPHRVFGKEGVHVHHRAGDGMMNLSGGYVEVLTPSEHRRTHVEDVWTQQGGIPVLVTQSDDGE